VSSTGGKAATVSSTGAVVEQKAESSTGALLEHARTAANRERCHELAPRRTFPSHFG